MSLCIHSQMAFRAKIVRETDKILWWVLKYAESRQKYSHGYIKWLWLFVTLHLCTILHLNASSSCKLGIISRTNLLQVFENLSKKLNFVPHSESDRNIIGVSERKKLWLSSRNAKNNTNEDNPKKKPREENQKIVTNYL